MIIISQRHISPFLCALVSLTGLMGCNTTSVHLPVPINVTELKAGLKAGPRSISGRIFFEPDRGHVLAYPDTVVSCGGRSIVLMPYTDFTREWALAFFGRPVDDLAYRLANRGPQRPIEQTEQLLAMSRTTDCDREGNFSFKQVASGDYFVLARVD